MSVNRLFYCKLFTINYLAINYLLFILFLQVLLIDSHKHSSYGALISQARISKLKNLCLWYSNMLCSTVGSKPYAYELSFLYYKCKNSNNKIANQ